MLPETLRLALRSILRNALRSTLTVLGVVIGVAAVISMLTIGQGSAAQVTADISSLGTNLLMLWPGPPAHGPGTGGAATDAFDTRDVDAIETLGVIRAATPTAVRVLPVSFSGEHLGVEVVGTDERFFDVREWPVEHGRRFHAGELASGAGVCILGSSVREELFGAGDPLGAVVRVRRIACRVVGVLESKGASSFGDDQDDLVLVPLRLFHRRVSGDTDVGLIFASVHEGVPIERAKGEVERLLRERRRIAPGEEDDFKVMDLEQIGSMLSGISNVLTGLLSAVAAVSLLVGGIGIMNIMLVSVTERTREIGIRLAVGATERQVLVQFLVEAIVLSAFGGLIGILLGLGVALAGTRALRVPFAPEPGTILMAFAFSAVVGIVFGFFPARRAARLDPIEALRHH